MGLIGKILKSVVEDEIRKITTEIYQPAYTKDSRQVAPPGIDANPLADDQGAIIIIDNASGKSIHVGVYPDPQSEPGEIRIYGRDSTGIEKGSIFLKNNGDIIIDTISANITLKENGDIDIAGGSSNMFFKTGGDIEINGNADNMVRFSDLETAFNQLKSDFNIHTHVYTPGPLPPAPTAIPVPVSTADVSPAKIDEVKTS